MIEYREFSGLIARLEISWGTLDDKLKQLYYDKLKSYPPWVLKKAFSEIFETYEPTLFPKLAVIIKLAENIRQTGHHERPNLVYCDRCNSTGWQWLKWKEGDRERWQAFRCGCENGQRLSKKIHTISEARMRLNIPHEAPQELQVKDLEEIKTNPNQVFGGGVCVKYRCKKCGSPYFVNFEGHTPAREVLECYRSGLNLCDACYKREGERRRFWEEQ